MRLHKLGYGYIRISKMTGINRETIARWLYHGNKPYSVWADEQLTELSEKKRAYKLGSLNPSWKGDKATVKAGYRRAEKIYFVPNGYERHHIDRNPLNNDPSNILIVTRRKHQILDGRMGLLKKGLRNIYG